MPLFYLPVGRLDVLGELFGMAAEFALAAKPLGGGDDGSDVVERHVVHGFCAFSRSCSCKSRFWQAGLVGWGVFERIITVERL